MGRLQPTWQLAAPATHCNAWCQHLAHPQAYLYSSDAERADKSIHTDSSKLHACNRPKLTPACTNVTLRYQQPVHPVLNTMASKEGKNWR